PHGISEGPVAVAKIDTKLNTAEELKGDDIQVAIPVHITNRKCTACVEMARRGKAISGIEKYSRKALSGKEVKPSILIEVTGKNYVPVTIYIAGCYCVSIPLGDLVIAASMKEGKLVTRRTGCICTDQRPN